MASKNKITKRLTDPIGSGRTVLICGQTGSGKTAVAAEFALPNQQVKIGDGAIPSTKGIKYYKGKQINIYDSEGYEIGKQRHYKQLIIDGFLTKNTPQHQVNGIWYVISGAGKRITSYDISLINQMRLIGYKVAILITKIDEISAIQLENLRAAIQAELKLEMFVLSTHKEIRHNSSITDWEKLAVWSQKLPLVVQKKVSLISRKQKGKTTRTTHKRTIQYTHTYIPKNRGILGELADWADNMLENKIIKLFKKLIS